jgi:7-cyano-7-deazaguanine synthase
VLLSGGIDSAVCLAMAVRSHGAENVTAVHVHYSQPHSAESWHAARLAKRYHVPLATVHASPWGQLPEPTASNDPMVIPGRNALLIALAAALVPTAVEIQLGCNADDQRDYPDCRPEFLGAMSAATGVAVTAPLSHLSKAEVCQQLSCYGIDLSETLSCYRGTGCGECAACSLREAALL